MLGIGEFAARDCFGVSRRSFLTAAASLPLAWGLPKSAKATDARARAQSVIFVWLWGGPSQLDTFDPKPNADVNVRGPLRPIATSVPGVQFSEVLPGLAARANKVTIIRSSLLQNEHETITLRGVSQLNVAEKRNLVGDRNGPSFGSIVARRRTVRGLPSYIAMNPRATVTPGNGPNIGAGRFGGAYDPFSVRCSTRGELDIASLRLLPDMTPERLTDRRALRATFDDLRRRIDATPLGNYDEHLEGAYEMLSGPNAVRAFNLGEERDETRNRYGRTYFGQSILLARRLAEARVPYIHVNWSKGVDCLEEGPRCG